MASLQQKLTEFARSPKGQQLVQKAKDAAGKPENRAKIEQLRQRFAKKQP